MTGCIEKLNIADYNKCSNIWDISACEYTEKFRQEILSGNRVVYIYKVNGEFLGEIAFVLDMQDPDYTVFGQRVYISRLIVKQEYRNQGIGGMLIDHVLSEVEARGYPEASIGVDKDNEAALHLYRKKGFTTVLFDGEDEAGPYFKLLRRKA